MENVAIIGAGLAGLTAAAELVAAGREVTVFDKSRGTGGRLATRRGEPGPFDHGAPRAHGGADFDAAMSAIGAVRSGDGWAGTPGMSGLVKPLERGVEIRRGVRIVALEERRGWRLHDTERETHGPFAAVIVAIPAPQAADLVPEADLSGVMMIPQWTLMAAWEDAVAPRAVAPFETVEGRYGHVVAHAGPDWSAANLERGADEVARDLVAALRAGSDLPPPVHAAAHRWRHARTATALGRPVLAVSETCLLGGDWTLGPQAGHAWKSGRALALACLGNGDGLS